MSLMNEVTYMSKDTAIFAGGCFWCMVEPFDKMPGIISVRSGYTGALLKIQLMSKYVLIQQVIQKL